MLTARECQHSLLLSRVMLRDFHLYSCDMVVYK